MRISGSGRTEKAKKCPERPTIKMTSYHQSNCDLVPEEPARWVDLIPCDINEKGDEWGGEGWVQGLKQGGCTKERVTKNP